MSRLYYSESAEREADKIGERFAGSSNVMQDMARAYHTDFSAINIHTDDEADRKVRAAGKDALTMGSDLFFGKGIFESSHPAAKALVGHELAHTMQQNVVGGEMAVQESVPMGAAQGGNLWNWIKNLFGIGKKNKEDEIQFSSAPETSQGKTNKEIWAMGTNNKNLSEYRKGLTQDNQDPVARAIAQRTDLHDAMKGYLQTKDKGTNELYNNLSLTNASGTVSISGLRYGRLVPSLLGTGGGTMSKDEILSLYDKLLSGGEVALLSNKINKHKANVDFFTNEQNNLENEIKKLEQSGDTAKLNKKKENLESVIRSKNNKISMYEQALKEREVYEANGSVAEKDKQFDEGFIQLKQIYLTALRRMKTKYGAYITQMHPDDFIQKIGMDFFDDISILQDTQQMMVDGAKYFDYANNPDDAEFKLLNDYYGDAKNQIEIYMASDLDMSDLKTFNPQSIGLEVAETRGYLDKLAVSEKQLLENNKDIKGFSEKEQADYNKRLHKKYKKKGWLNRLIGRFRK